MLLPLLKNVANKVVLDAACGTGRWLEKLFSAGAKPGWGVDISEAMLLSAKVKPGLKGRLVRGDCVTLPFQPRFADLIISSFALGHIGNLDALAQELARVARDGADLWVSDLHPEARVRGWATAFRHKRGNAEIIAHCHTIERINGFFMAHGFSLLERHDIHLGDRERPIFEGAGKAELFKTACELPAVCLWHFKNG